MKLEKLKEILIKDFAVKTMRVLCSLIKVINKLSKDSTGMDPRFYRLKTKNYHVAIIADNHPGFLLVKPRGFLKEWVPIEKDSIPAFLAADIFNESCTEKERKRLVNKIVELKAFW